MLNNSNSNIIPKRTFNLTELKIINLVDVHFGNIACEKNFFKKVILRHFYAFRARFRQARAAPLL